MLSIIQKRIERSLFEQILKVCVTEGYTPDIKNTGLYGSPPYTAANQTAWNNALNTITSTKGFAIEEFGHSQTKGLRKVPRIVIIPRRVLPGDIGSAPQPYYFNNPTDPMQLSKMDLPSEASHFYIDIHLVSNTANQDRILNSVLSKSLALKKYIPWYDDLNQLFFVRQTSYYDLPDPIEGQEEKVYTYEIPDIYDVVEEYTDVPLITQINMELISVRADAIIKPDGTVTGVKVDDGGLVIDGGGIVYN